MKLKISDPKTIDELKQNIEHLAEKVIGKDIVKNVEDVDDTTEVTVSAIATTETADEPYDANEVEMLNNLKTDVTNLQASLDSLESYTRTVLNDLVEQFNLLKSNIEGQ